MGHHTFPIERADKLEDPERYRYCSREELLDALGTDLGVVVDLGSGTGFFTDDVAPYADTVYAIDVQPEMHGYYRDKGVPGNVELVTSSIEDLPLEDGAVDVAFSTMTYHEFQSPAALAEIARVLKPDGRLVVVDWTANGEGTSGPPVDERYDAAAATTHLLDAGFGVGRAAERLETFFVVAKNAQ